MPSANVYAHTKKPSADTSDSLTVNWGGEKASPSSLSRLPPNQNLNNADNFSRQKVWAQGWEQNREKDKFALVTHTTRAPSACASKLLYPQNGGVGAWAIHGIWWIVIWNVVFQLYMPLLQRGTVLNQWYYSVDLKDRVQNVRWWRLLKPLHVVHSKLYLGNFLLVPLYVCECFSSQSFTKQG